MPTVNTTPNISPGMVVQVVRTTSTGVSTGTTLIPADDTIPQNTEGDEYMTLAITPRSTTNLLIITANVFGCSSVITHLSTALFQDSTAGALAATAVYGETAFGERMIPLIHSMTAGTASSTTFKIRAGGSNAGTFTFNGVNGGRFFGAITKSVITIVEVMV